MADKSSLSLFHFLFCQLIEECYKNHKESHYLEALRRCGSEMGFKLYSLICSQKQLKERPGSIHALVSLVKTVVFKYMFDYEASNMYTASSGEEGLNAPKEYFYVLEDKVSSYLAWMPENLWDTAALVAGIIEGICLHAGLDCRVSSFTRMEAGDTPFTEYQIKISEPEYLRWRENE